VKDQDDIYIKAATMISGENNRQKTNAGMIGFQRDSNLAILLAGENTELM
jgi:hypothetical protein